MKSPLKRAQIGLFVLVAIFVVAATGYRIAGWGWLDSIYMVVTTLSMVGYRDDIGGSMTPGLQVFTIMLIAFGVSTVLYILGGLFQMITEGEVERALGLQRITREIKQLSGHVIICGFGRVGETLAYELHQRKLPLVIVENDAERVAEAALLRYLAVNDDATEEESLLNVGVAKAKTLVTTLPRDAENVFITLTARNLNKDLQIIARGESRSTEKKLIQAGADRVVLPAAAGALRMAAMIARPSTLELIELVAGRNVAEVVVDEFDVPETSPLVGRTVREVEPRSRYGLMIVAVRHPNENLLFNPDAATEFKGGGGVVVMGRSDDIERFRKEYGV